MRARRNDRRFSYVFAMAVCGVLSKHVLAVVNIYGGATFVGGPGGTGGITGQSIQVNPGVSVVPGGTAIARGTQSYFSSVSTNPTSDNTASFIYTSSGTTTLQSVGTRPNGNPNSSFAYAINASGMVSGYVVNSTFKISTAVRWSAAGVPTALSPLSVSSAASGDSAGFGYSINDSGIVAGSSAQYSGATSLGNRPVLWAANSTTATPLGIYNTGNGNFGLTPNYNSGNVNSINSFGSMVGSDEKYLDSGGTGTGGDIGGFASVWNAAGAITQLVDLPGNGTFLGLAAGDNVNASTVYSSVARVINDVGTVAGTINKYDSTQYANAGGGGGFQGIRPVRWNSNTNTVQLLDAAGTKTNSGVTGYTSGNVNGMNAHGDIVGAMDNYTGGGTSLGTHPALWKVSNGTALTPLGLLGTSVSSTSSGAAFGINDYGWSVGNVQDFTPALGGDAFGTASGTSVAALWDASGAVTDLNLLITTVASGSGTAGWVILTQAYGITNDGWITGLGTYNPGSGLPTYTRAFLLQDTEVPEPACAAILVLGASLLGQRRRANVRGV